jgi:hypothetical protein
MRTRSCKRNAHDAHLRHSADVEQQHNRKRRTANVVHGHTTGTVSNIAVKDAEEVHIVVCRTEGCAHRPSPRKRTQQQQPDGTPLKKRICCTMCACVTTLQVPDARPHPREPDQSTPNTYRAGKLPADHPCAGSLNFTSHETCQKRERLLVRPHYYSAQPGACALPRLGLCLYQTATHRLALATQGPPARDNGLLIRVRHWRGSRSDSALRRVIGDQHAERTAVLARAAGWSSAVPGYNVSQDEVGVVGSGMASCVAIAGAGTL